MKTLTTLATEVNANMSNPRKLGEIYMYLGAMYAYYSDQLKPIKVMKSRIWLDIKRAGTDSKLSDRATEMEWRTTPEGEKEQEYKYLLDGIANLQDAIKQAAYLNHQEIKNQS